MSQPMGGEAKTSGVKLDGGKNRLDLMPVRAWLEVGKVLTFGALKYGANNWRKVEGWRWRYIGAGLRHVTSYMMGERSDPESGLHHLAHAMCCLLFVLDNELTLEVMRAWHDPQTCVAVPDGDAQPTPTPALSAAESVKRG